MNFNDNLDKLKQNTKSGNDIKHKNDNSKIIPFVHRGTRAEYNNGFYNIIGHLSRYLLGYEWDENLLNNVIPELVSKIHDQDDGSNKEFFKLLLQEYLFNSNNEIIVSHPHLYLFAPPSYIKEDESDNTNYANKTYGERQLAQFLKDVFFNNYDAFYSFLSNKESDNYIFKFILENIELNEFNYSYKPYYPVLSNVIELFQEDFSFAMDHPSFLLDNIDEIFAYYYFFYSTQLILNIHKDFEFCKDNNQIEEFFYLLDGEIAQDFRKAVHVGYGLTSSWVEELLCKVYVIDQLNILMGTNDYMLGDILNFYEGLDGNDQENFYSVVKDWVQYYRNTRKMDDIHLPIDSNLENLKTIINILFKSLMSEKGVKKGSRESRYPLNLLELGKNFHLIKFRSIYKYVLNMTNDMLLLLTTLTVKNRNDMKVNELFLEFRKRGIFFDEQSEEEVLNFLSKRNLIDKKSDSEEAIYVKPIL